MDFVEQDYWDKSYQQIRFATLPDHDPIKLWLTTFIPNGNGTCLEVGCFPGGILSCFGELGYELHGIDLTPRVEHDLPAWLNSRGYRVGKFTRGDFARFTPETEYDIVASFGFIEHFSKWETILLKQASLVKKGGLLVIEAPNFRGIVQRLLHLLLDRENYERHNIASMNPYEWAKITKKMGFEIVFCGFLGNFLFWTDDFRQNWAQKLTTNLIHSASKRILKKLPNSGVYSPFCGLICKKL